MKTAYTTHGLLFDSKDNAIVVGNNPYPIELHLTRDTFTLASDETYVNGVYSESAYQEIEVTIGVKNSKIELEDVRQNASVFFVEVLMSENYDPELSIKDRNFKLEHLSMELQQRIHKVANEMYIDWLKVKQD